MLDSRRFYKELGNLFYAIAAADKHISRKEKKKLDDEVQFAWKHYDHTSDRFGSDRAFLIEFEFETMEDSSETSENAFQSFATYFMEKQEQIDELTRNRIFNSARHIAESMRGINQEELRYLMKLKELMKI
ncbi:MAG: hypothetical protein HZB42_04960 [Sphingobacteriales bacterium]|nr:hypothetical protein [Sphingobacteriales bacterium]